VPLVLALAAVAGAAAVFYVGLLAVLLSPY